MLCLSPNGSNYLYSSAAPLKLAVATVDGIRLFARETASVPWSLAGTALDDCHVSSILWDPDTGNLFAGTHDQGIHRSLDEGRTWERVGQGVAWDNVFCLARAEQKGGTVLYAGLEPVGILRSDDQGATWTRLPNIERMPQRKQWTFPEAPFLAHLKFLAIDPRGGQTLYACVEQGALLKSDNGGEDWRELTGFWTPADPIFRDIHRVNLSPDNPDHLWMMTGTGIYRSYDAGERWIAVTELDFRVAYPDHFVMSADDPEVVFVAGAIAHPGTWHLTGAAEGAVMRSGDGGKSWTLLSQAGAPDGRMNIEAMASAHYPGGMLLVIGDTDGTIMTSEDEGQTWQRVGQGAPVSKSLHWRPVQPRGFGPPPPRKKPAMAET